MPVQRTPNSEGGLQVTFGDDFAYPRPPVPAGMQGTACINWVDHADDVLDKAIDNVAAIRANKRLSTLGQDEQTEPWYAGVVESVAKLRWAVDDYEKAVNAEEATMYHLPELHPTATVFGQREQEIRTWFRNLSTDERHKVRQAIQDGTAGQEVEIALMRSPIQHIDADAAIITAGWRRRKESENPDLVASLAQRREAIDYARRAMGFHSFAVTKFTGWNKERILQRALSSENEYVRTGATVFGTPQDIAKARFVMEAEKNRRLMGRQA
jgi:hypothetical protein